MWFAVGKRQERVAVYRTADPQQAEVVSNALEAAGISYRRTAGGFHGFLAHSVVLPPEWSGELFSVLEEEVGAARQVLASLPFPPPEGQPAVEEPTPASPQGLEVSPEWSVGVLTPPPSNPTLRAVRKGAHSHSRNVPNDGMSRRIGWTEDGE